MAESESLSVPKIDGSTLHVITRIGRSRAPAEACGLLLIDLASPDQRVIELANRSLNPMTEYKFTGADVEIALEHADKVDEVVVWHTHPGGSVGPSTEDMMSKVDGVNYLVVTIFDDDTTHHEWF